MSGLALHLTAGMIDGWPSLDRVQVWTAKPNYKEGDAYPWYDTSSGPAMEMSAAECVETFGVRPTTENMCIIARLKVDCVGYLLPPGTAVPSPFLDPKLGEPWE